MTLIGQVDQLQNKNLCKDVYSFHQGMAADLAGLKEGDELVSVNKQDISHLKHEALVAMIKKVSTWKL